MCVLYGLNFQGFCHINNYFTFTGFSQIDSTKKRLRHELGLDPAQSIFLLRKNDAVYLISYKYHFNKYAIRTGLDLSWEDKPTADKLIEVRVGIEKVNSIKNGRYIMVLIWNTPTRFSILLKMTLQNMEGAL